MQKFKGKKRYIIASLGLILCLLFFVGAKKYFDTADDVVPSRPIAVEWLVEPNLYAIGIFRSGLGWIQKKEDGPWALIDGTGKILVDGFEAEFFGFYDEEIGLASFINKEGLSGYVDRAGDLAIPPRYNRAGNFKYGMAVVAKKIDGQIFYGVIDRYGTPVLPFVYKNSIEIITPELFAIEKKGKWGCINKKGEVIIDFIADLNSDLEEESAVSSSFFYTEIYKESISYVLPQNVLSININGKKGLIRTDGSWILPASYDNIFSGKGVLGDARWAPPVSFDVVFGGGKGLIGLEKDGKVGFVDAEGKTVIDFKFYGTTVDGISARTKKPVRRRLNGPLYAFSEGLAVVLLSPLPAPPEEVPHKELLYGVIDTKGNVLFKFKGSAGDLFDNGFTHLWDSPNKLTLIDRFGERYSTRWSQNGRVMGLFWDGSSQGVATVSEKTGKDLESRPKYGYLRFKINREVRSNDQ